MERSRGRDDKNETYVESRQSVVNKSFPFGGQDELTVGSPSDVLLLRVIVLLPRLQTDPAVEASHAVCVPW